MIVSLWKILEEQVPLWIFHAVSHRATDLAGFVCKVQIHVVSAFSWKLTKPLDFEDFIATEEMIKNHRTKAVLNW